MHHFAPPVWTWDGAQLTAACLDDKSAVAEEMLKRFAADGVNDYDIEP